MVMKKGIIATAVVAVVGAVAAAVVVKVVRR